MDKPGLLIPPLTPFRADLKVDEPALQHQIEYVLKECNAAMVVAAGVEAQEYHYLPFDERKNLIKKTIDFVGGRVPVMAGISHPSFKTAIELAHFAEKNGAKALQLLAPLRPFGGPPTDKELVAYFEAVTKETKLPVVLYLNPGPGADVSVAGTIELAKLDGVKYVKESSRDLARVSRLIVEIQHAGHAKYFTTMQMLLATLELGGAGATMPPPGAELANKVIQAFLKGDYKEAARLQLQFAIFPHKWMHRGLTTTLKAAMKILNRSVGEMYPPFPGLTAEEFEALRAYLKTTDFVPLKEQVHA